MRNFKKLQVWNDSINFGLKIYKLTLKFPKTEIYGLSSQLQRAAVSISSNIAEGSSRSSNVEFARFLEIALGSCFEVESQLKISNLLMYLNDEIYQSLEHELKIIEAKIYNYKSKLKQT